MARLPDEPSNPNAADFDRDAITDFDRDASTDIDRDATADQDPDATTGPAAMRRLTTTPMPPTASCTRLVSRRRIRRRRPNRPPAARATNCPGSPATRSWAVLGAGGMGIVYKARHLRLDRLVALKMIKAGSRCTAGRPGPLRGRGPRRRRHRPPQHHQDLRDRRARRPALLLAGVPRGRQPGGADRRQTAAHRGRRREIVETLARAMDVAHRRGIVHRDIKPANVLLAGDGTPKIADFGLVKRLEADSGQTGTGWILGSPSYMAPEQTTGAEKAGPAADQYALGATLYEMLTGRPPFRGSSILDTLDLIRTAEPVAPSQLLPRMPRDLETICLKALAKGSAIGATPTSRRWPTTSAASAPASRSWPGPSPAPSGRGAGAGATRPWHSCSARWRPRCCSAWPARRITRSRPATGSKTHSPAPAVAREEKARSDLRWYAAESTLAQKDWEEGEIASLERRLDVLEPHATDAPDLRSFEWYHLKRLCRLEMQHLARPRRLPSAAWRSVRTASCSLPPAAIMANREKSRSGMWRRARNAFACTGHKDLVSCVAFSPDGRRLASANGGVHTPGEIKIWDPADGRELSSLPAHATSGAGPGVQPGRPAARLLFRRRVSPGGMILPGEVKVWDAADGRQTRCAYPGTEACGHAQLPPSLSPFVPPGQSRSGDSPSRMVVRSASATPRPEKRSFT